MKTKLLRIFLFFSLCTNAQRPANFFKSEIIIGEQGSNGQISVQKRFTHNQNIELDLNEQAYLTIRKENSEFPYQPMPLGAYIKDIEVEIQFQGKIYEPTEKSVTQLDCETTPSNFPFKCIDFLPIEVKNQLNTRNINELKITIRQKWRTIDEVDIKCKALFPTDLTERRIDVFTIDVKHFGLNILVDLKPIANTTNAAIGDVLRGFFSNLSYSSIDYALTTEKSGFSNILLTSPIIKYEGRHWLNKNIEGQATIVRSLQNNTNILGYGFGLGFIGDSKIFKGGVYWYQGSSPNYYFGVSIIGLANWITNNNSLK